MAGADGRQGERAARTAAKGLQGESLAIDFFDAARLDIEIIDRSGQPGVPKEWFLVPVFVIDEAVERIKDGSISGYIYDPVSAKLVQRGN